MEHKRIQVLNAVISGEVTVAQAAGLMELSERHAWRLLAAYRKEGASAIAHGNRDRNPTRTTATDTQQRAVELAQDTYAGLNHTHLTEVLYEREGISLSRSTVRRMLLSAGLRSPRPRRAPRRYSRRDPTQFARALSELDIGLVLAHTPQAKGRIERVWGTFQDRLVSEMRLAGVSTIEQANRALCEFLPRFNGSTMQLMADEYRASYARANVVEVQERLDGSIVVTYQGRVLAAQPPAPGPVTLRARNGRRPNGRPPTDQPVSTSNGAHTPRALSDATARRARRV